MAQQLKVLVTKPDSLSSGPTWQKEKASSSKLSSEFHTHAVACMHVHTHAYTHIHTHDK